MFSSWQAMTSGVPHVTVLGHQLCMNQTDHLAEGSHVSKFADNKQQGRAVNSQENLTRLQGFLFKLNEWDVIQHRKM